MNRADIGMIGLAVMGENLVLNMESKGFTVAVYNRTVSKVDDFLANRAKGKRIVGCHSLVELCSSLSKPAKVMLMVKAGTPVDEFIAQLLPNLQKGDIIIDGGNSHFPDTIRRCRQLQEKGIHYIGTGVSGGEEGALLGPSIMPGGSPEAWPTVRPIFQAIAARTPDGEPCCDWLGNDGAGHFVKMVHNGIEYGLMAAYAEGLNILKHANAGHASRSADAETSPLREPRHYQYEFDLPAITELWRRGSVVTSWLLDLTAKAMLASPQLENFSGRVSDSGEGRWTIQAAVDEGVPAPVLTASLFQRFSSRGESAFADRILSAMRYEFGGHSEKHGSKG